jgi:hypothetical protein
MTGLLLHRKVPYNIIRKEDKKEGNNNIHTVSLARSSGFSKPVG